MDELPGVVLTDHKLSLVGRGSADARNACNLLMTEHASQSLVPGPDDSTCINYND